MTDPTVPPGESALTEFRAPQGLLRIGERFGRYEVIRQLGSGGMGHVYEAWDRELHEAVALKVIRREVANDPDADARFKNELTLARHITHKNVVRIHDLGQVDGVTFISMAIVDGVDLSAMFKRERLPVDRALSIARQLCDGLAAAHEAGVVHRDLKPSNVMVDRAGRVYLLDFGLARSIETAPLTQVGAVVGTVDYFAPEQAMGGTADDRTDIYALGLILYELFTGVRPFRGETAMLRLSERLHKPAPDARTAAPEIPASIARVIGRCLERSASARYQSVNEILADLTAERVTGKLRDFRRREPRTIALVMVAIVMAGVVGSYLWRHNSKSPVSAASAQTPVVSLAILPFRNASGERELEWLASAVPELIRAEIGQPSSLRIVSSSRVSGILGDLRVSQDVTFDQAMVRRIADFSNADVVISGEYSRFYARSGSVIRFDVVVDGPDRATLTADAAREADIPRAVKTLVRALPAKVALRGRTTPTDALAAPEPITESMAALKAYTEGQQLAQQGNDVAAIERLRAATEADPHFALAFASLAESCARAGFDDKAAQAARQAAAVAGGLPPPQRYRVEGISARVLNDTGGQLQAATSLVNVSPADSDALFDLADLHEQAGRFAPARDALAKVLERDPKHIEALRAMARVEIRRGNPEAAFDPLNRALAVTKSTENLQSKANLFQAIGIAYKQIQKPEEALRCYQQSLEIKQTLGLKRGMASSLGEIAQVQEMRRNFPEAEQAFRDALALMRELGDKGALSSTLVNFGRFLNDDVGRPDEGLPLLREALQIRRETGNANGEAMVLNNLGAYYQVQRQFVEAQAHFELALKIREKDGSPRDIADVLHNLAETLVRRGQYDQSHAHYLRARDLRRKVGDRAGESIESYSIGTIYDDQGHVGSAVEWKENALTLFRGLERKDFWLVEMLSGVGRSLVLSGRTDDAVKYLDEAMRRARELGNQQLVAAVTISQADRLYYSGDVKGAYNLSEQAVQAAGTSKNRERVLHGQAIRAIADGSLRPSRDSAARLATLSREADTIGLKALAVECAIHRADTLSKLGNLAGARQEAEHALEQAELFGLRLSLAKAHLVHAGTVRERDGDCAAASRILDAIRAEPGSEHLLKRFDLTELAPACAH